ncbi:hydroxymethylbilane synthase [Cellulomonas sp. KRMCY2]|uniref:hydroxymethylbilane synthase n=1 Tax=Cellulomonas sp. KRMCY2 TaxID=1304865 RepID=UPI00045E89A7|nr:hydroxymethylbilane synthase [Cellulomonas sp. KRMCY2]
MTVATVRVGTRASALALAQTGLVAAEIARLADLPADGVELVTISTEGDRLTGPLAVIGGTGVFVTALREAVLDGRCDLAVHSYKDLPTVQAPGLVVAAVPDRADARDALCARDELTLAELPDGARVGTGSPRRAAQLLALRPDLVICDIRGNVDTRLGRVAGSAQGPGDLDAVVLAAAGLTRLDRLDAVTELLDELCPAAGQGALAVECRAGTADATATALGRALAALDHLPSRLAVTAERALLAGLEAGCAAPVGAHGRLVRGHLILDAVVSRPDGGTQLRTSASVPLPDGRNDALRAAGELGAEVARRMLLDGAADLAPLGGEQ